MGTRTFCDMCGNTIRNPRRFIVHETTFYGPENVQNLSSVGVPYQAQQAAQQMLAASNQAGYTRTMPTQKEPLTIELCPHCVNVWWDRVEKLTRGSDVPISQN